MRDYGLANTRFAFLAAAIFFPLGAGAQMSIGFNFQDLGWGSALGGAQPEFNYFASKVDWATTTNPWNPTFLSELAQAKPRCLRFMDWGEANASGVTAWSQRIPKTADHYLSKNKLPTDNGSGYGVAYEWMIDLCNRMNADMWVCVPHMADTNFAYQLATLIKNNLNPGLKVYVEYSNECWNDGFTQTGWLDAQRNIKGLANPLKWQGHDVYGFGDGGDCRWSEYVYLACRMLNQFNKAFGTDNPRVVKVLAGQAGWGHGTGSNQMCEYHLACMQSPICNPWGVKIDAYGIAPYWNADNAPKGTEAAMRAGLADCVADAKSARKALTGSGIPLVFYEGGPDNDGSENLAANPFQYQLTIDALNALADQVQGIFNYYTFNGGGVWGLKKQVGDDPALAPKWRGYIQWLSTQQVRLSPSRSHPVRIPGPAFLFNLQGRNLDGFAARRGSAFKPVHDLPVWTISVPEDSHER